MYKSILVPLDGSMRAEVVLPYVEDLAHRYSASVTLLRVVELAPPIGAVEKVYATLRQQELDRHTREAQAYLAVRQGILRSQGIQVETSIVYGPAVEAILKVARRDKAGLIVVASRGWHVATALLQRAPCPLLLIPTQEEA